MENILEIENDYTITFNDTKYPINKELLYYYSPKLKEMIEKGNDNSLDLTNSSYLESSFASFIDACQNRPYSINPSNFYDIQNLSFYYQVKHIIDECNEFSQFCPIPDILIHRLLYKIRKHGKTQNVIFQISRYFSDLAQRKELLLVPQEYLEEIIKLSLKSDNQFKPDQSIIFKFLTTKYEQDEHIAHLFEYLDPNKFTIYELNWILDHPKINTDFISKCYDIRQKTKTINEQIKERQEKIDNYAQTLSGLENHHHYHSISRHVQKLKDKYIKAKSETDEETVENTEYENQNDSDVFQEIEARIEAIFGKESGISEVEKQVNDNGNKLDLTESDAEDLRFLLGMTLQRLQSLK